MRQDRNITIPCGRYSSFLCTASGQKLYRSTWKVLQFKSRTGPMYS